MEARKKIKGGLLLALAACVLTACGARTAPAASVQASSETSSSAEEPAPEVPEEPEIPNRLMLPDLDVSGLKASMPAADYAAFEAYLPVLVEDRTFRWTAGPYRGYPDYDWEAKDVTLVDFHNELWDDNPHKTDALVLDRLAVQDVDGDGTAELVMLFQDMAYNYLVLSQREDAVYGTDFSVRWFMDLQKNGVYVGSGGAGYHTYYRMSFQNGRFEEKELAQKVEWSNGYGCDCTLDGQPVTEAEFDAWYTENMVGDVTWYAPGGAVLPEGM